MHIWLISNPWIAVIGWWKPVDLKRAFGLVETLQLSRQFPNLAEM